MPLELLDREFVVEGDGEDEIESIELFNPAHPENLARLCYDELLRQPLRSLDDFARPNASAVYAIHYVGSNPLYRAVSGESRPVYVGKSSTLGLTGTATVHRNKVRVQGVRERMQDHRLRIERSRNLSPSSFLYRALYMDSLFVAGVEEYVIRFARPVWNVCLVGFGSKLPSIKHTRTQTWWDALHGPDGQPQREKMKSYDEAYARLHSFVKENS